MSVLDVALVTSTTGVVSPRTVTCSVTPATDSPTRIVVTWPVRTSWFSSTWVWKPGSSILIV